eukprot:gene20833-66363_t
MSYQLRDVVSRKHKLVTATEVELVDVWHPAGAQPPAGGVDLPEFERTQFPLLPACTITDRMAQGMTIPGHHAVRRAPATGRDAYWIAVYVALSRATSLENLLLLGEPERAALEQGPPQMLVDELERLDGIAEGTLREWERIVAQRGRGGGAGHDDAGAAAAAAGAAAAPHTPRSARKRARAAAPEADSGR